MKTVAICLIFADDNGLPPELSRQLGDIYSNYKSGSGDCDCTTNEALDAFKNAGINGQIVEVRNGLNNLLDANGNPISGRGWHQAVQVGDRFYDALTHEAGMPNGATWDKYKELFMTNEFRPLQLNPPHPFTPREPQ